MPWYKHRSLVYLWLLIAPPIGIYGLWKSSDIPNAVKVALGVTPIILILAKFEVWLGLLLLALVPAALIYLWWDKGIMKKTKILYTLFSFFGAIAFAGILHGIFFPENEVGTADSNGGSTVVTETSSPVEAGFDCNAAGTVPKKAICASDEAKQADKDMVDAYKVFEAKMPPAEHDAMWKLQKIWLLWRDNHIKHTCYTKPTKQLASKCITKFYKEHTATLNTYLSSRFIEMRVFNPPSNIREKPYGAIICVAPNKDEKITIYTLPVTDKDDDYWYWTEYCSRGKWGLIHDNQVRPL